MLSFTLLGKQLKHLAFMALGRVLLAFLFTLSLAKSHGLSTSTQLKGSVNCLDCPRGSDLSGIRVLVKCEKEKKLAVAYTEEDGTFETKLPSDQQTCMAKIMGGPHQLYASAENSIVPIAKASEAGHFTTSKPLDFYKACPFKGKCEAKHFGSSKTVDLPLPREWGLAPSSYYIPFIPIIGIP